MGKPTTVSERINIIKEHLGITEDKALGALCGMSKSVVNQISSGKIKSFAPRFAYKLESKSNLNAKWIMMGEGPMLREPTAYNPESLSGKLYQVSEKLSKDQQRMLLKFSHSLAEPEGNGGDPGTPAPKASTN